jgi:hypothetical protein
VDGGAICNPEKARNFGTILSKVAYLHANKLGRYTMGGLIYLVGLVVVVMAILSFFGLR